MSAKVGALKEAVIYSSSLMLRTLQAGKIDRIRAKCSKKSFIPLFLGQFFLSEAVFFVYSLLFLDAA